MLFTAAFGWGISAFGIFLSWPMVVDQLAGMGARQIPDDPMLNYWLRMTSTAFTFIGLLFLMMAINPKKYITVLPLTGYFMITEGLVLFIYGHYLNLALLSFYIDTAFCLFLGVGILLCLKYINMNEIPA
jgi:hypothetical protein